MLAADQSPAEPIVNETQGIALAGNVDAEIEQQLEADRAKSLLRFSTAGSVDDGKSTLIGRLLYDSRNVYDDHIRSVTHNAAIDFAQLTDGLRAEREQGITIDVAYRYFSTPKRKFIIADTPGHEQYTRNMATGASTADVAIVLVDARKGILDQTRRHTCIAALLGIPIVIAAVNKMDLVDFSEAVFNQHRSGLEALATRLQIPQLIAVPVSALEGDNVVHRSTRIPWYSGPSLLELLETVPLAIERSQASLRFAVQRVVRPHQDFRGFAGQIAAGTVRPGDEILALPSGRRSRVKSITTWEGELASAAAPQSVVLSLEDEVDLSRGDMIAAVATPPHKTTRFDATVVWMQTSPLQPGATYLLKHTTQTVRAQVAEIRSRIDVVNLSEGGAEQLGLNDIGDIVLETSRPLLADLYRENRTTGSFILIDPATNATAGAGMMRAISDSAAHTHAATGLLTVGNRSELADRLEQALLDAGALVLRTHVQISPQLLSFARLGAFVIVESDAPAPITFARADTLDSKTSEIESDNFEQILGAIERLGSQQLGDDNDHGLGI
ncbi:MAG TPA: sulfate adenylyltransferase subunit CysN [Terracidiphilus sp.]|jgi:sulfate adenylyltransferase subunit 1|nr:sulfate adenylyltransferase subunit CysN [Terracidiphilus sp.]